MAMVMMALARIFIVVVVLSLGVPGAGVLAQGTVVPESAATPNDPGPVSSKPEPAAESKPEPEPAPMAARGPAGEPGPPGPQGPQGKQGPRGEVGPQGPQGAIGPQGPQGAIGSRGPRGETGDRGPRGPGGPKGPRGPGGPKGERGKPGAVVMRLIGNSTVTRKVEPGSLAKGFIAFCPSGWTATGGGFSVEDPETGGENDLKVILSQPFPAGHTMVPRGWQVRVLNTTGDAQQLKIWAVCADTRALK